MSHYTAEKSFEQPWHATAFALAVHLHEAGHFTWPEWADSFSTMLAQHGVDRELDGGDDYYNAWIATLQHMLEARRLTDIATINTVKNQWEAAYLATPHGEPVHIGAAHNDASGHRLSD